jgi:hypothetical protein
MDEMQDLRVIDSLAPARSVAAQPSFRYAEQIPLAVSQTARVFVTTPIFTLYGGVNLRFAIDDLCKISGLTLYILFLAAAAPVF